MTEKSFLEILTEKIEKRVLNEKLQREKLSQFETSSAKNSENVDKNDSETLVEPQWVNQIPLGKIHFSTPKSHVFGRVYPVNAPKPQQPAPPRKKHLLSESQKQAMVYFWAMQTKLQDDFTMSELKKAFRRLAHKLHPDHSQGNAQAFIELKAHYQCLMSVFLSNAAV